MASNFTLRCALSFSTRANLLFVASPIVLISVFSFLLILYVRLLRRLLHFHLNPSHTCDAILDDTNTFGKRMAYKAPAKRGCHVNVTHLNCHRCFGFPLCFATMFRLMAVCECVRVYESALGAGTPSETRSAQYVLKS